jgi:hypothetical protein
MSAIESQQVSFWDVHMFVQRYLDTAGHYPAAGTPAWRELPSGDRRKWAALLAAAEHHVLRVETAQEALAEASRDIGTAADWSDVARELLQRAAFRKDLPWLLRGAA